MTDFLSNAVTWLMGIEQGALSTSDTLTYTRTGEADLDLTDLGVVFARHTEALETGEVITLDVETVNYFIPRTILDFGSGPEEPAIGDKMIHNFPNGLVATFEAIASGGQPVWYWHDPQTRNVYRVQMDQVELV